MAYQRIPHTAYMISKISNEKKNWIPDHNKEIVKMREYRGRDLGIPLLLLQSTDLR